MLPTQLFKGESFFSTVVTSEKMVERVKSRLFKQSRVLKNITNVDTGRTEVEKDANAVKMFKKVNANAGLARDIVAQTLEYKPESNSQECIDVITPFLE